MIDTIVLLLSSHEYTITDHAKFSPCASWITNPHSFLRRGKSSKQNPSPKELKNNIYKPRLSLFNHHAGSHHPDVILKIEASLPKLLYTNNLVELSPKDFNNVLERLIICLQSMGVQVAHHVLEKASVSSIHYAKNIVLKDGSTPYQYIQKIKEANISLKRDINQAQYRNEGHSYKWHCNSYEVIWYDKIKDLQQAYKSPKRTLERDATLHTQLYEVLKRRKKFEILRLEVRLIKKAKIKHLFKHLSIRSNLSFKALFKKSLAQRVLMHYFNELESLRPAVLQLEARQLIAQLAFHNPTASPKTILQIYGLQCALEQYGLRELRGMFARSSDRTWYRLMNSLTSLVLPGVDSCLNPLRQQLATFKTLTMKDIISCKQY